MSIIRKWALGWKQIGSYLNRTGQTAKRYHKKYGMPVRRDPGGRPIILLSEVDEWLMSLGKNGKGKKK